MIKQLFTEVVDGNTRTVSAIEIQGLGCVVITNSITPNGIASESSCFVPGCMTQDVYSIDYINDGIDEPEVLIGRKLVRSSY